MSKSPKNATDRLVWVDLETTGLYPDQGSILEVACVVTDWTLKELYSPYTAVVHYDKGPGTNIDPFVLQMHADNGLWPECERSELSIGDVDKQLSAYIAASTTEKAPLAGSTISFDRAWMDKHMPLSCETLHFRNVDVSSFKIAMRALEGRTYKGEGAHRALPDIRESISHLRQVLRDLVLI